MGEDGGRIPSELVRGIGADWTVWGVGGDGVHTGEDVEIGSQAGG